MHQINLGEIYFRIVCLCISAALLVLLLFSLCFLEALFCTYICTYASALSQNVGRGQRCKETKLETLAGDFPGVSPFNCLSVASHSGFLH